MNVNIESFSLHRPLIPVAKVTFPLDMRVYRMVKDSLEKTQSEYIKRNNVVDMLRLEDEVMELTDGRFIIMDDVRHRPSIYFGKLYVLSDDVCVHTRNGYVTRKVDKGQVLKVESMKYNQEKTHVIYGINSKEYISSLSNVKFISGYFTPASDYTCVFEGKPFKIQKKRKYPYSDISGSKILLENGIWLDIVLAVTGEIEKI